MKNSKGNIFKINKKFIVSTGGQRPPEVYQKFASGFAEQQTIKINFPKLFSIANMK